MQLVISVHPCILRVIDYCFCVIEKDLVAQMWIVLSLGNDTLPKLDVEGKNAKRWTLCALTGCVPSLSKIYLLEIKN